MGLLSHVILVTHISHDTVHFWAPTFKWGISIANIADFSKPPETLSYPQQLGTRLLGNSFSSSPFDLCLELCSHTSSIIVQLLHALDLFGLVTVW